jgi:hypothetical protein
MGPDGEGETSESRRIRHLNTRHRAAELEHRMALFGLFGRKKAQIRDPQALAAYIDEQAFALVGEGIQHNVRARAGEQADRILAEDAFARLVETARWRTYPLGLAMTAEVVDSVLRPQAGSQQRALADETIDLVLGVFDRHPIPDAIGKNAWLDARSELAQRLDQISTLPPRDPADIPSHYTRRFLAEMPAHGGMTHPEAGASLEALKRTLGKERQDLDECLDAGTMVKALLATGERS